MPYTVCPFELSEVSLVCCCRVKIKVKCRWEWLRESLAPAAGGKCWCGDSQGVRGGEG